MTNLIILNEKRVLIVDDEPDIIESIQDSLDMCYVDVASTFDSAKYFLTSNKYDVAILDIMGVKGYELLSIANERGIPAVMLTAHALSPENFVKSMKGGACAYLPKDELFNIDVFLVDIFENGNNACGLFGQWFNRLKGYYEKKFGADWLEEYKGAWH